MKRFLRFFCRKSAMHAAIAWALIAMLPACQAQTSTPAAAGTRLDKHARKIEKRLVKYGTGRYLEIDFRNGSQSFGSLGALSYASFEFTDADNNRTQTFLYSDVARVKKAKEYIGEGSEHRHHVRLWVLLVITAAAAGGAVAAIEETR